MLTALGILAFCLVQVVVHVCIYEWWQARGQGTQPTCHICGQTTGRHDVVSHRAYWRRVARENEESRG